jgi:hypothetical protein
MTEREIRQRCAVLDEVLAQLRITTQQLGRAKAALAAKKPAPVPVTKRPMVRPLFLTAPRAWK